MMFTGKRRPARLVSYLALAGLIMQTAGCSSFRGYAGDKFRAYTANTPEVAYAEAEEFSESQLRMWAAFLHLATADKLKLSTDAELAKEEPGSIYAGRSYDLAGAEKLLKGNYRPVVNAGIVYVNERCNEYLSALNFFARTRDATSRQINAVGTAAGAALAVVEASKRLIGLTPLGFKVLDDTVLNVGKGLLFELPPPTVKKIVKEKQSAFLIANANVTYDNRVDALRAIQNYVDICLPTSIESEVEAAITRTQFKQSDDQPKAPAQPAPAAAAAPALPAPTPPSPGKNEPPIIVPKN